MYQNNLLLFYILLKQADNSRTKAWNIHWGNVGVRLHKELESECMKSLPNSVVEIYAFALCMAFCVKAT